MKDQLKRTQEREKERERGSVMLNPLPTTLGSLISFTWGGCSGTERERGGEGRGGEERGGEERRAEERGGAEERRGEERRGAERGGEGKD